MNAINHPLPRTFRAVYKTVGKNRSPRWANVTVCDNGSMYVFPISATHVSVDGAYWTNSDLIRFVNSPVYGEIAIIVKAK